MLTSYSAFVDALSAYGFMGMSASAYLPSLSALTPEENWHQDDKESDPWAWRMRLPAQKDGAYARILFGKTTFIAPAWYGVFLRAFECPEPLEERYARGVCDPLTVRLGALFDRQAVWSRHALASALGRTQVKPSQLDRALIALEREMRITISGDAYRISREGVPYGWPSVEYTRVDVFAPPAWRECALSGEQAREAIAQKVREHAPGIDARALARMLGA